jgi:UDP-glucose 4-epimerase
MSDTVLLTGAAGFIPSHIVDQLLDRGFRVIGVDDFSQGNPKNISHLATEKRFEFHEGDIRDDRLMRSLIARADYIVHGAVRGLASSVGDPMTDLDVNTAGTLRLLRLAVERKVKRFVYASSASVYGSPEKLPESERDCVGPLSPYAVSKLAGEQYCLVFHRLYGVPAVCLRYFNTYGARQTPHSIYGGVVSIFIDRAVARQPLSIFGDGTQTRDFTFVGDSARATADAMMAPGVDGAVLNIGSGVETSVKALAAEILGLVSETQADGHRCDPDKSIVYESRRVVDNVARRCADISLATQMIGYVPRYDLREGLRETIKGLASNP